jgi:hypothetical protein
VIVEIRVSKSFAGFCPKISNDAHHFNNMIQDSDQMGVANSGGSITEESIVFINTDFIVIYIKFKVGHANVKPGIGIKTPSHPPEVRPRRTSFFKMYSSSRGTAPFISPRLDIRRDPRLVRLWRGLETTSEAIDLR